MAKYSDGRNNPQELYLIQNNLLILGQLFLKRNSLMTNMEC